jgi:hypothetical protein
MLTILEVTYIKLIIEPVRLSSKIVAFFLNRNRFYQSLKKIIQILTAVLFKRRKNDDYVIDFKTGMFKDCL